ncbi:MAG: C1 family peptidase [Bacteroidia bacterium]
MVQDEEPQFDDRDRGGQGGGGGGSGCLFMLLPLFFQLFRRNPTVAIGLVVVVLVAGYCFNPSDMSSSGDDTEVVDNQQHSRGRGCDLKQEEFDKASVFAALAPGKNAVPDRVSLEQYCPKRKNQGMQGSCVAWSCSYGARTILQAISSGQDPNRLAFSPAFMYNQIGLQGCQGAYLNEAMDLLTKMGAVPFDAFPYDENDCSREPSTQLKREAGQFKMRGHNRLTKGASNYSIDFDAIKHNLAQGGPVAIGMMVGGTFMEGMFGKKVWHPTRGDYGQRGFGGHAMCIIGYDDNLEGGAFQIMNSWGPEWGINGIGWVTYEDFKKFGKEAYGLDPMPKMNVDKSKFAAKIGLVTNNDREYIPLKANGNTFSSASIKKGTKFKMEITNSIECHIYVFGLDYDKSNKAYSKVLFPYTPKHSAFCGILGTRLFPSDYSMMADDIGNQDYMAVVITKEPIDYNALNDKINKSSGSDYRAQVMAALGNQDLETVQFKGGQTVDFSTDAKGKNAVAMIIEVNKQ